MAKQLWVLAGGNGAGKSTFHYLYLRPLGMPLLSVDIVAKELEPDDPDAAVKAAQLVVDLKRGKMIEAGATFCYETVFSHVSKVDFLAEAKSRGYQITLIYIHLDFVDLNQARVKQRVSEGGHDVPSEKIATRIPRTMDYVSDTLGLADHVRLLDNSSHAKPFELIASIDLGNISAQVEPAPDWAIKILKI